MKANAIMKKLYCLNVRKLKINLGKSKKSEALCISVVLLISMFSVLALVKVPTAAASPTRSRAHTPTPTPNPTATPTPTPTPSPSPSLPPIPALSQNAIWVASGKPSSVDLAFFASHDIFTIYWEAAIYGTGANIGSSNSNPVSCGTSISMTRDISCSSITDLKNAVAAIHSYNSQFKVILWLACWNFAGYGYPDYSTQAKCNTLCSNEANFVSQCGFDGVASDLEQDWWTQWTDGSISGFQLMINYYNTEAQYIHALGGGKITVPFLDTGAYRSPSACLSYIQTYLTQLTGPDYLQFTGDMTSEQNYNNGATVGFIPNLNYLLTYLSKPLVIPIGYEEMSTYTTYLSDYFSQYGTSSQIVGYSLYDYAAGLSGTPPSNQVGNVDSPISASDWLTWNSFISEYP